MPTTENGPWPIRFEPLPEDPLVSVLVANYEYERYLGRAIESALDQTWPLVEVVVCDDGSRDGSVELVRRYESRSPRVRLVRQENAGQGVALSRAYAASRGEILSILDADDVFHPTKVRRTVEAFRRAPEAGLCCHPVRPIGAGGHPIGTDLPARLETGWLRESAVARGGWAPVPPASGISFRRALGDRVFPVPASLRRMADGFVARGALFLAGVAAVPEPLADYRIHGDNVTGTSVVGHDSLLRTMEDGHRQFAALREFVAARCGHEVADRLREENMPGYLEQLLALELLDEGVRRKDRCRHDARSALPLLRRWLWSVIGLVPTASARARILSLWWGYSPMKRSLSRLIPLRLGGAAPRSGFRPTAGGRPGEGPRGL